MRRLKLGAGLLVTLALLLTAGAAAHSPQHSRVPSCGRLSNRKLSDFFDLGRLKLNSSRDNVCTWFGKKRGHYHAELQIGIAAGSKSLFATIIKDAKKSASENHARFNQVRTRNPAIIEVIKIDSSHSERPCPPHHRLPTFGPPTCSGDPTWNTDSVDAYGKLKHGGTPVIVSANSAAELGDVGLHAMVQVAKEILAGKLG